MAKLPFIFTRLNLQPSHSRNAKQHCSAKPGHHLRYTPLILRVFILVKFFKAVSHGSSSVLFTPAAGPLPTPPLLKFQFADDATPKGLVTTGDGSAHRGEVAFYTKTTATSEVVVDHQKCKANSAPFIMSGSTFQFVETFICFPHKSPDFCADRTWRRVGTHVALLWFMPHCWKYSSLTL